MATVLYVASCAGVVVVFGCGAGGGVSACFSTSNVRFGFVVDYFCEDIAPFKDLSDIFLEFIWHFAFICVLLHSRSSAIACFVACSDVFGTAFGC